MAVIHNLVEKALKENVPVKYEGREVHPRNSDKALIVRVWEQQGFHLNLWQTQQFFRSASPETVRRIRQKVQEKGLYPADENVQKERRYRSYRVQQVVTRATAKYIEQVLL